MSNRDYKNFTAGNYYHVYNRGNGRMDVYKDEQDYFNFLKRLRLTLDLDQNSQRAPLQTLRIQPLPVDSFSIVCYCLMPNHFHFVIRQNKNISISLLINKICSSYSKYFNKKYDHVGHLFQDQFKAVLVENDDYLLWLSAYIHQNPKVAKISDLNNYRWSSYCDYANLDSLDKGICDKGIILDRFNNTGDYISFVEDGYEAMKQHKNIDKYHLILD